MKKSGKSFLKMEQLKRQTNQRENASESENPKQMSRKRTNHSSLRNNLMKLQSKRSQ